jgi:hypothetical protein
MASQERHPARDVPPAPATGTGRSSVSDGGGRLGRTAGLVGLAAGALCLAAACGSAASSAPPPPATVAATPTQSATQPSTPAPSSQPAQSPATGSGTSSGTVTAAPATSAQVAALTAAAAGKCGFTSASDTLTDARVTNNGWASAAITARNPQGQGNSSMIFRLGSTWTYDTCGSDFSGSGIPSDVLTALSPG